MYENRRRPVEREKLMVGCSFDFFVLALKTDLVVALV